MELRMTSGIKYQLSLKERHQLISVVLKQAFVY